MSRALPLALLIAIALSSLPAAATAEGVESSKLASTEEDVLGRLNQFRQEHGLTPLLMVPAARAVAGHRARSMKRLDYFGHVAPGGLDAGDLLRSSGVRYRRWGEVIGRTRDRAIGHGETRIIGLSKISSPSPDPAEPTLPRSRRRRGQGRRPHALHRRPHGIGA